MSAPSERVARAERPDPSPDALVVGRGVTKRFGRRVAVDGIDFHVERGEVFGFLGPNGAGKTSTMRMVGCVSPVDGGELSVLGMDPTTEGPDIRARLGVVPQEDNLDVELTVAENLFVYGRYFGLPRATIAGRVDDLLEFVQLRERRDDRVDPLSGGMKRRLTIARGLVNEPDLLLLDEPTAGLDPQARHLVWDRLYRLKRRGVSQVLTTHYMDEAEQLCDRLVIMDRAEIVAEGSPRELVRRFSAPEVVELRFGSHDEQERAVGCLDGAVGRVEELADRVLVYTGDGDAAAERIGDAGIRPDSMLVRRSTLEDVFLTLTGRTLEE